MNKFLHNLVYEIKDESDEFLDLSSDENTSQYKSAIGDFISNKLLISISNNFFERNLGILTYINNANFLKAIISLPVFINDDNLMLLIFDADKKSDEFILIDKSDSMVHSDVENWEFLKNDVVNVYDKFEESQDSIILPVNKIIESENRNIISQSPQSSMDSVFLELSVEKEKHPKKYKTLSNKLADDLPALNEEKSWNVEDIKKQDNMNFSKINELFYLKRRQNPENLLYKNEKQILDEKVHFQELFYLADLKDINFKDKNDSILIKKNKHDSEKLVFYNHEIEDFNNESFIELNNFCNDISKEFLYYYLNSTPGMADLIYFSKSNRYIEVEHAKKVKIPVPSLNTQEKIVKAINESRQYFHDVELLKKEFQSNILDYKHMNKSISELRGDISFDITGSVIEGMSRSRIHAYKGLIWPLAISYLYATKGSYETVERLDNYLTLFEFIAAFNAVILISSLPEDVYEAKFKEIWNLNIETYKKEMSFGNWIFVCKNIGKIYRKNNFQTSIDKKLIDTITSNKIINILFKALNYRNDKHHGSLMNSTEAKKILDELEMYLEDIFDILDVYSDYKLIYSTSQTDIKEYSQRVILLNGPCDQPIYEKMFFDSFLEPERLYLYNNNKKLLIKDSLMKFTPTDKFKKHWAILIYNSCEKNKPYANYKCFQSEEYHHREKINDFEKDILRGK